jgi:hypothetical protein
MLTDKEMALGQKGWRKFPDPFHEWKVTEAAPETEAAPTDVRA